MPSLTSMRARSISSRIIFGSSPNDVPPGQPGPKAARRRRAHSNSCAGRPCSDTVLCSLHQRVRRQKAMTGMPSRPRGCRAPVRSYCRSGASRPWAAGMVDAQPLRSMTGGIIEDIFAPRTSSRPGHRTVSNRAGCGHLPVASARRRFRRSIRSEPTGGGLRGDRIAGGALRRTWRGPDAGGLAPPFAGHGPRFVRAAMHLRSRHHARAVGL